MLVRSSGAQPPRVQEEGSALGAASSVTGDTATTHRLVVFKDSNPLSELLGDALPSPRAAGTFAGRVEENHPHPHPHPQHQRVASAKPSSRRQQAQTANVKLVRLERKNEELRWRCQSFAGARAGGIVERRARALAEHKVRHAEDGPPPRARVQPLVEMSARFTDGLSTMGTRFSRFIGAESGLPLRALYNETLDRIKRSEFNRLDKTTSSFVVRTPHRSQVKASIDVLQLGNGRRLKVLAQDKKASSARVRERWQKAVKKVINLLRMKRLGLRGPDDDQLAGFHEAELEQNPVVRNLASRYSSRLDELVRSVPGAEQALVQAMPPLKLLRQRKKFCSTVDHEDDPRAYRVQPETPPPERALSPRQKRQLRAKALYTRWWMPPPSMQVARREQNILEDFIRERGAEAVAELRAVEKRAKAEGASDSDDSEDEQEQEQEQAEQGGQGAGGEGEYRDPLPLRNDPYKHTVRAMQNFVKPIEQHIQEQLRKAQLPDRKLMKAIKQRAGYL